MAWFKNAQFGVTLGMLAQTLIGPPGAERVDRGPPVIKLGAGKGGDRLVRLFYLLSLKSVPLGCGNNRDKRNKLPGVYRWASPVSLQRLR